MQHNAAFLIEKSIRELRIAAGMLMKTHKETGAERMAQLLAHGPALNTATVAKRLKLATVTVYTIGRNNASTFKRVDGLWSLKTKHH